MELEGYLRFAIALAFVLGLIGVLAVVARHFGFGYRTPIRAGRERRLSIVEIMPVDAKRRLVLLRRDSIEHLVLLGSGPDVLVEAGIAPPPARLEAAGAPGGRP